MLEWIRSWKGSVLYVFTKVDKLSANERAILKKTYEKEFGVENIAMFSASTGMGLETVQSWIERIAGQGGGI
jgi:GTP-binding protein EngB required for normal cell division